MKLTIIRKVSFYFITLWYFYLFAVYPFAHVHRHQHYWEACFTTEEVTAHHYAYSGKDHSECHHKHFRGDVHNYESAEISKMFFSPVFVDLPKMCLADADSKPFVLSHAPKRGPSDLLAFTLFTHAPPSFC